MATPLKLYVVIPAYDESLYAATTSRQFGVNILKPNGSVDTNPNFNFFHDRDSAMLYAKSQTARNGGVELVVCEATTHFFAKPSEVRSKDWKGKELVPSA